jgi:NIMA (never in mitosis gene a)-related kinase
VSSLWNTAKVHSPQTLGGDLNDVIAKHKERGQEIPEDVILELFIGMLLGVQYIHQNNIVHLDLKPNNILLDDIGNPKISDFGIAKTLVNSKKGSRSIIGSYMYMSPEALLGKNCETNTDIWSLGCIMHELCCFSVWFSL